MPWDEDGYVIEQFYDYLKGNKNFKQCVDSCILQRQVVTRLYTKYGMDTINCCFRSHKKLLFPDFMHFYFSSLNVAFKFEWKFILLGQFTVQCIREN